MEEKIIVYTVLFTFCISYICFWIYVFKYRHPKKVLEKKTYILKEFDEEKDIFVKDLVNNSNFIISKIFGWRFENDMFIKGDKFIKLSELIYENYYKIIEDKHF